jgi:hypothetical protein
LYNLAPVRYLTRRIEITYSYNNSPYLFVFFEKE